MNTHSYLIDSYLICYQECGLLQNMWLFYCTCDANQAPCVSVCESGDYETGNVLQKQSIHPADRPEFGHIAAGKLLVSCGPQSKLDISLTCTLLPYQCQYSVRCARVCVWVQVPKHTHFNPTCIKWFHLRIGEWINSERRTSLESPSKVSQVPWFEKKTCFPIDDQLIL